MNRPNVIPTPVGWKPVASSVGVTHLVPNSGPPISNRKLEDLELRDKIVGFIKDGTMYKMPTCEVVSISDTYLDGVMTRNTVMCFEGNNQLTFVPDKNVTYLVYRDMVVKLPALRNV